MGFFDGEFSSVDLVQLLGIFIVVVINVCGMGQIIGVLV